MINDYWNIFQKSGVVCVVRVGLCSPVSKGANIVGLFHFCNSDNLCLQKKA